MEAGTLEYLSVDSVSDLRSLLGPHQDEDLLHVGKAHEEFFEDYLA